MSRGCIARLRRGRRGGSALIIALWAIGLMSLLISAFAFDAHLEARVTSYYRKRTKAEFLAQSGLEVARMLLIKRNKITGKEDVDPEEDRWYEHAKRLKKGAIRGLKEKLGEGTVTLDIVPEPARRNINNLDLKNNKDTRVLELNLERILQVAGITEELDLWPELIDSFIDWIDANDEPRFDGAETDDYYGRLDPPYKAKNGPFDTVGELLLVKGFNRQIVYGGTLDLKERGLDPVVLSGLDDLLTVYGSKDGRIDINTASKRVLMTLPDADDVVAGAIIEEREGWEDTEGKPEDRFFDSVGELFARIPELPAAMRPYLTVGSGVFRITCTGEVGGVTRTIWCIAELSGEDLTILRWREED